MSFENFEKKYNLIYDIPYNPTERLNELIKELKEDQLQFGNRFKEFAFFLRNMINQITSSARPETTGGSKEKPCRCSQPKRKNRQRIARITNILGSYWKKLPTFTTIATIQMRAKT